VNKRIGILGGISYESTKHYYMGRVTEHSKEVLLDIIQNYAVDGVIWGCTELPLIIKEDDLDVTVLNTSDIHVEAVLQQRLE
jgi:aspartate racemase